MQMYSFLASPANLVARWRRVRFIFFGCSKMSENKMWRRFRDIWFLWAVQYLRIQRNRERRRDEEQWMFDAVSWNESQCNKCRCSGNGKGTTSVRLPAHSDASLNDMGLTHIFFSSTTKTSAREAVLHGLVGRQLAKIIIELTRPASIFRAVQVKYLLIWMRFDCLQIVWLRCALCSGRWQRNGFH